MKIRSMAAIAAAIGGLLLLATPATAQEAPCSACGPGEHWIDTCGAGQDTISDNGALVGIDTDLDCQADPGMSLVLGPCSGSQLVITRSDPLDDSANFADLRTADSHFDVIDTEIVSMCLIGGGVTLVAGGGQGQGGVLSPSLGAIAEDADDSESTESFFDVFFEVDLGNSSFGYNQTALRIAIDINCVPPQAEYIHVTDCLELFTSPVVGEGTLVANLVSAEHHVNISAEAACCLSDGECTMRPQWRCELDGGALHPGADCSTTGACCQSDGTCLALTKKCCQDLGGTYQGNDTQCLGDGNNDDTDDACEEEPPGEEGACCLSGGECILATPSTCEGSLVGTYQGDGTQCLGDGNNDDIDDAPNVFWPRRQRVRAAWLARTKVTARNASVTPMTTARTMRAGEL
ncbi:MAG: hypothetical protein ACYTFA_08055 [Planctomycetota bacterium]|jgi:hypothetical protein